MSVGHGDRSQMSATARHEANCRSDRRLPVCGAPTCFRRRGPLCVAQERLGSFVVAQKDPAEASTRHPARPAGRAGLCSRAANWAEWYRRRGRGGRRALKRVADDGDNGSERRSPVLVGSSGVDPQYDGTHPRFLRHGSVVVKLIAGQCSSHRQSTAWCADFSGRNFSRWKCSSLDDPLHQAPTLGVQFSSEVGRLAGVGFPYGGFVIAECHRRPSPRHAGMGSGTPLT
jgi:hypothetical protein